MSGGVEFADLLAAHADGPALLRLTRYAELVERWSGRHNLVRFSNRSELVQRHILEALAAAPLLKGSGRLLDVGSGAGLPGVPLLAVRPQWGGVLLEPRQKRWAFLRTVVRELGLEACVTLGMLDDEQTQELKDAGLTAYNHNLDTSEEYYGEIITTRTYKDRLDTIARVAAAGISVCAGGIIGMGESIDDRVAMLVTLASLSPQPESVPVNALVAVPGTPLGDQKPVDSLEMVRMCAVARIMMPGARVRLSAGRASLSREAQLLCFMAGANSSFFGDKLLTTGNPDHDADLDLLREAGLSPLAPEQAEGGDASGVGHSATASDAAE